MNKVSDIDLRLLNVFICVVECGGYSAAQAHLNIGLATISAHMKSLEDRLGVRLCQRGRAGFKLTMEGEEIYREAIMLTRALERFTNTTKSLSGKWSGKLIIGIVDTLTFANNTLVSDAIRIFNQQRNNIEIHLHIASRQDLEKCVLDGTYDLAIGAFEPHYKGLSVYPLYQEEHALYCGVGHSFYGRDTKVSQEELANAVVVCRGYTRISDGERIGSEHIGAVVFNLEAQLTLLLSGGYIGFFPVDCAERWVREGKLSKIPTAEYTYISTHAMICRQSPLSSARVQHFVDSLLLAHAQQQEHRNDQ